MPLPSSHGPIGNGSMNLPAVSKGRESHLYMITNSWVPPCLIVGLRVRSRWPRPGIAPADKADPQADEHRRHGVAADEVGQVSREPPTPSSAIIGPYSRLAALSGAARHSLDSHYQGASLAAFGRRGLLRPAPPV